LKFSSKSGEFDLRNSSTFSGHQVAQGAGGIIAPKTFFAGVRFEAIGGVTRRAVEGEADRPALEFSSGGVPASGRFELMFSGFIAIRII